jgi:hypothetical protein
LEAQVLRTFQPLLEGEPDSGGQGTVSPEAITSAIADLGSQLNPSPPATEPVAGVEESEPADTPTEAKTEDPDTLDPEERDALVRRYGAQFRESPEYQADIERQVQGKFDALVSNLQSQREADPEFQQLSQASSAAAERAKVALGNLTRMTQEARMSGIAPDPEEMTAEMVAYGEHIELQQRQQHLADRRGTFHTIDTMLDEIAGSVAESVRASSPEVFQKTDEIWKAALAAYNRFDRAGDPRNKAKAMGEYLRVVMPGVRDLFIAEGERRQREKGERELADKLKVGTSNALQQARAEVQAQRNPPPADGAAPANGKQPLKLGGGWRADREAFKKAGIRGF